jgi:hypothetical protein
VSVMGGGVGWVVPWGMGWVRCGSDYQILVKCGYTGSEL